MSAGHRLPHWPEVYVSNSFVRGSHYRHELQSRDERIPSPRMMADAASGGAGGGTGGAGGAGTGTGGAGASGASGASDAGVDAAVSNPGDSGAGGGSAGGSDASVDAPVTNPGDDSGTDSGGAGGSAGGAGGSSKHDAGKAGASWHRLLGGSGPSRFRQRCHQRLRPPLYIRSRSSDGHGVPHLQCLCWT